MTVFSAFVTACRFAAWPTTRWPVGVIATTDGVVRYPRLGTTVGVPPSRYAMQHVVVPRSIPMTVSDAADALTIRS